MELDDHGQPVDLWFQERLRVDRSIHEMLGLIKGVLVDGVVTEPEAVALRGWFVANPDALRVWPGKVLGSRLERIFEDGVVDDQERQDLLELMQATVGVEEVPDSNPTATLPLDLPAPRLLFPGMTYVFTGKFVYGTRAECQRAVAERGASCINRITQQVNTLVIGCVGSRDWAHTSYGRKIEAAVRLKEKGLPLTIVSEQHWSTQLIQS